MKQNLHFLKRLLFTLTVVVFTASILPAQVAVNTDGTAPDGSAMLDVKSSDKGLLIPRLTTAARNTLAATAVAGLMVYDTDLNKFFFFNGVIWDEGSTGGLWSPFLDDVYLTNGNGNVGIGKTNPNYALDIYKSSASAWVNVKSVSGFAGLMIDKASASSNGYIYYKTDGAPKWFAGLIGDNNYAIDTSFTNPSMFYMNRNGNIGIGTGMPDADLEITDVDNETEARITRPNNAYASLLTFYEGSSNKWSFIHGSGSDKLLIRRGNGNAAGNLSLMDNGGYVGIGTSNPQRTLEVKGTERTARVNSTTNAAYLEFLSTDATDWAIGTKIGSMRMQSSTDGFATSTDRYIFGTTYFHPYSTNVRSLGISAYRWSNVYSYDGSFSDDVTVGDLLTVSGTASIGTVTQMGKLHVHDAVNQNTIAYLSSKSTNDSTTLFFSEGTGATLGMYWMYDGYNDEMELWGRSNSTEWGPHLLVKRNSGNMAIGSTFASGYKLSVEGKIICEELRVDLVAGWPDYVFGKDYKLMSLKELDTFIETNGHLPNIPAAEEIDDAGLDVGEMQRLMMEKIEELSLYIIQQQKEIDELKNQINKNRK